MTESTINEQYQEIIKLIRRKQLKDALAKLFVFLFDIPNNQKLTNELERIETSYGYMLEYMRKNMVDPDRKKLHTRLLTDALALADQIRTMKAASISSRLYFSILNYTKTFPQQSIKDYLLSLESSTEEIAVAGLLQENAESAQEIRRKHEGTLQNLFDFTWTNSSWSSQDNEEASEMLTSVILPINDLCLFVSAITMSLMECFDSRKIMWLFKAYEHEATMVNQRALVGLAFVFQLYHERMLLYPEIISRLALLNENEHFSQELSRVQIQMLLSKETVKIDRKMREEIIPEVIKSVQTRNTKFDFDDNEEGANDHNPEWILQNMESSPLADKLREMNELQMEGADIYMSTFAQLKSYPFFRSMANWFCPFDSQHSAVTKELNTEKSPLINMILESGFFCDSDKYSMCFTVMHIPQGQRDAMISQLSEQQMSELMNDEKVQSFKKHFERPEVVSNLYIHNLYRFFKLFPRRMQFRDIFNESLQLYKYTILQPILCKPEYFRSIAEFLLKKEYMTEAANIYESLLELTEGTAEIYQKIGYCRQKERRYTEAIEAYHKADFLKPDNLWTNKHLAVCYRNVRDFKRALEYYRKVEAAIPENKQVLFNIGSCLAELNQNDEALNYFFKLDFMDAENLKVWRAIAWCSFISGKHEQAKRYYDKIIGKQPNASDYLNAGHLCWSSDNIEDAIKLYSRSIEISKDKQEFLNMFYKDTMYLTMQGINEDDIPLMLDLL